MQHLDTTEQNSGRHSIRQQCTKTDQNVAFMKLFSACTWLSLIYMTPGLYLDDPYAPE
jgi:hypothetical protein